MRYMEKDLFDLINEGKTQGFLTYDQVNKYLPDEDASPEKLEKLLVALEEAGIELVEGQKKGPAAEKEPTALPGDRPKLTDDPIRMYLSQMAEIPLLTRDEEIALAKRIEVGAASIPTNLAGQRFCIAADRRHIDKSSRGRPAF